MKVYLAGYSPQHAMVNSFPPFPGGGLTALHSSANSNPFSVDFLASKTSLAAKRAWANSTSHYQWFKIYSSNMNIFTKITENSDVFEKIKILKHSLHWEIPQSPSEASSLHSNPSLASLFWSSYLALTALQASPLIVVWSPWSIPLHLAQCW